MPYGTINADVIQSSVSGVSLGAGNATNFKNRIINGDMRIDQRNAGASVTATNGYNLDRWQYDASQASKFTVQQNAGSVTPPVGFTNYLGMTVSSAFSVATGDYFLLQTKIEGLNVQDLAWGTSDAKTVTLSFWVRSSLTGTFGGAIANGAANRSYPFTYTISSANTWTQISVTVAGDTTGTWATNNTAGMLVRFGLGAGATYSGTAGSWSANNYISATGATSVVGTNGATFYITGVQLEVGSLATGFEYRDYGRELAMCQRYAIVYGREQAYSQIGGTGIAYGTTNGDNPVAFPVQMRTVPSLTSSGNFQISDGATGTAITNLAIITTQSSSLIASVRWTVASGATSFRPYRIETNNSLTANVLFSAEL